MRNPSLNRGQQRIIGPYRRDEACRVSPCKWGNAAGGMNCLEPFEALGGYPVFFTGRFRHCRTICALQPVEEFSPVGGKLHTMSFETRICALKAES